jgi:hypothetical protein
MVRFAQGGNYEIELVGGVAHCRVWRRPDVDHATGARFAQQLAAHLAELLHADARALVLDLREAPPVQGPRTQAAVGGILGAWEANARPAAFVVTGALSHLQMVRLAREHAPHHARVFQHPDEANAWVLERLRDAGLAGRG